MRGSSLSSDEANFSSALMDKDVALSPQHKQRTLLALPRKPGTGAPHKSASVNRSGQVTVSISTCKTGLEPGVKQLHDR